MMRPKIGDLVQWTANGIDQFVVPKKIIKISECKQYCFVEGSKTGLPIDQISVIKKYFKNFSK